MLRKLFFTSLTLGFIIAACAKAPPAPSFDQKFNQLQLGQSTSDVQALLGAPDLREVKDGKETWHYKLDDPRDVEFKDGKVAGFFKGTPNVEPATPAVSSATVKHNLKIGEACQDNKECQSLNCHFHTCSGGNNCSKNLGDRCANDSECCSGFCDFAVCKKKI